MVVGWGVLTTGIVDRCHITNLHLPVILWAISLGLSSQQKLVSVQVQGPCRLLDQHKIEARAAVLWE